MSRLNLSDSKALALAEEAYIFGFPLVLMDMTRRATPAPANQFMHAQTFPDPDFTVVVTPNADTLYSSAWLNVAKEPIVLSVPPTYERYYVMQLMDAWTNVFAAPGTRTTGNQRGDFAITGPRWTGALPEGVHEIEAPTSMVWVIGRTQTNGRVDYDAVHQIQKQYKLTPLGVFGRPHVTSRGVLEDNGADLRTPPPEQTFRMDASTFFSRLNALMRDNPPARSDAPIMERIERLGVAPARNFDLNDEAPSLAAAIAKGVARAQDKIREEATRPHGRQVNGWSIMDQAGRFETDYLTRAAVALFGLGANLPEDAVYPHTTVDAQGQKLSGANRYFLHFRKDQLPPVDAFWSVTLYNSRQYFVPNPIGRYALGDRDALRFERDGSLTLLIQHETPSKDLEPDWLPAPADEFNLVMRLYRPKPAVLDGSWRPPPVQRLP